MIFKWIVTIGAIIFGTFFLAPWETMMMNISGQMGLDALTDADYLHNQLMNMIFGSLQGLVLFITVFISIFKPWKNILKKAK